MSKTQRATVRLTGRFAAGGCPHGVRGDYRRDLIAGREIELSPGTMQREKPIRHRHVSTLPGAGLLQVVEIADQAVSKSPAVGGV